MAARRNHANRQEKNPVSRDREEDRDYEPRERPTRRERAARHRNKKKNRHRDRGDGPRASPGSGRPSRLDDDDWQEEIDWGEDEEE